MVNNTPQELWDKLSSFKKVIMTLHRSPDGDSIGSACALKYILEKHANCKVDLISGDPLPFTLSYTDEIQVNKDLSDQDLSQYEALVCIDEATVGMLSPKLVDQYQIPENTVVVNIDHHPTNTYYGTYNFISPKASSACEVLLDLVKEWNIEIDTELSTRLLTGLMTDTGIFKFVRSSKIFKDAAFLMDQGVDYMHNVMEPITSNQTLQNKKFVGLVYSNIKFVPDKSFYYVTLSKSQWQTVGLKEEELHGAAPLFADLSDAQFVFSLLEEDKGVSGSFRSKKVDVSQIAQALGGGGHKPAAGLFLANMTIKEAEQLVLKTIKEMELQPLE